MKTPARILVVIHPDAPWAGVSVRDPEPESLAQDYAPLLRRICTLARVRRRQGWQVAVVPFLAGGHANLTDGAKRSLDQLAATASLLPPRVLDAIQARRWLESRVVHHPVRECCGFYLGRCVPAITRDLGFRILKDFSAPAPGEVG